MLRSALTILPPFRISILYTASVKNGRRKKSDLEPLVKDVPKSFWIQKFDKQTWDRLLPLRGTKYPQTESPPKLSEKILIPFPRPALRKKKGKTYNFHTCLLFYPFFRGGWLGKGSFHFFWQFWGIFGLRAFDGDSALVIGFESRPALKVSGPKSLPLCSFSCHSLLDCF